MTLLRFLNVQGIAGLAVSLCLAVLLVVQRAETRHWKKQSSRFEQLYRAEQSAFATTVSNYRAAADQARAQDTANAERVAAEQQAINERTTHDFEARIAAARAAAERLRLQPQPTADRGSGRSAAVPRVPAAASGPAQAPREDRLPPAPSTKLGTGDALTATEQAIQLDELIKWVKAQAKVDSNGATPSP
jgi:hypothetical protein